MISTTRRGLLLVLVVASFRFVNLDYAELQYMDEAMHASWARAVAEHGVWLDQRAYPVYDFQSRLYPPLFMWADALAFKVFGVSEAVPRVLPATAGFFLIVLVYAFGRSLGGPALGVWMGLLVGLDQHLAHYSRTAMLEVPYLFFLLVAFVSHWRGLEEPRRAWPILSGIGFGLCLMTKGVVALIFPSAAFLHALVLRHFSPLESRSPPVSLAARSALIASVIGLCIAAPWHIYMVATQGKGFVNDYFLWNVVERVLTGVDNPRQPLGFLHYFNQIPIGMPIAFPFFLAAIVGIVRSCRPRTDLVAPPSGRVREHVAGLLLASWFVTAFVLFSIATSKPDQYMVPMILPALLLAAIEANDIWRRRSWSRRSILIAGLPLALLWANGMPFRFALKRTVSALGSIRLPESTDLLVVLAGAGGVSLLTVAALWIHRTHPVWIRPRRALPALVVLMALLVWHRTFVVEPQIYDSGAPRVVDRLVQDPIRHLTILRPVIETPIIYYLGVPDASWQKEHLSLADPKALPQTLAALPRGPGEYVLVNRVDFEDVDRWGRVYYGEKLDAVDRALTRYGRMLMETRRYQLWELVQ